MSYFPEMDWNPKWDWENFTNLSSKSIESPKKMQSVIDWTEGEGEINTGSFNLSGGGKSGGSGSDGGGHGSSSNKSSIAASMNSSTENKTQTPNLSFMSFEGSFGNLGKSTGFSGTSPPLEAPVSSLEPLIGLKLGKRTYFENSGGGGNAKTTTFDVANRQSTTTTTTTVKKSKNSGHNAPTPICQVDGCNLDLFTGKEYHRKHKVCDAHSKCSKVVIGGMERRFCQQCSRFHTLSEFDDNKRSCRKRLSDHNARRRKPPHETVQFSSTRVSSQFYGGSQHMSLLLNNAPLRTAATTPWDNNSKFMLTKGFMKEEQLQVPPIKLPHSINMHGNAGNGFLASSKRSIYDVFNAGSKGSLISSQSDAAAPEYIRALSLLSNNSWVSSCQPESGLLHHRTLNQNYSTISQPVMQAIPLSSSEFWPIGQQATNFRGHSFSPNTNFQETQFKAPHETEFYSHMM